MPTIHVTERAAFKACRLYHHFAYTRGLVPLVQAVGTPRWFGVGIHYALATYYKSNRTANPVSIFDLWFEEQTINREPTADLENLRALGIEMLTGYVPYAIMHDNFDVEAVEQELRHNLAPGIDIAGTLDLLVRDHRTQRLWVVDHKTCAQFVDPEALVFDDQMQVYLWLVWKVYGEVPGGAIYSMLRKKIPQYPMVLKNGQLSKAKNIDTTQAKYLAAIRENNLDPNDYTDILKVLEHNEFFRRETIVRSRRELQLLDEQLLLEAREMTRPNVPVFPTQTQDCLFSCQFRDVCRTRVTGGDVEFAIQAQFKEVREYDIRWAETHLRGDTDAR